MALNPASGTRALHESATLIASGLLLMPSQYTATRVLPVVSVNKRDGYYYKVPRGSLTNLINTKRGDGTPFVRVPYPFSQTDYKCLNYGAEAILPVEQDAEFSPEFGNSPMDAMALNATHSILRDYENEVAGTLFNTGTYNAGAGNGVNVSNTWASTNGDPHGDIDVGLRNLMAKWSGIDATALGLWINASLASTLIRSPKVRTALGNGYSVPGQVPVEAAFPAMQEQLRSAFGLGEVTIAPASYRSGGTEAAPTMTAHVPTTMAGLYLRTEVTAENGIARHFRGLGMTLAWSELLSVTDGSVAPAPVVATEYFDDSIHSRVGQIRTYLKSEFVNATDGWYLMNGVA